MYENDETVNVDAKKILPIFFHLTYKYIAQSKGPVYVKLNPMRKGVDQAKTPVLKNVIGSIHSPNCNIF